MMPSAKKRPEKLRLFSLFKALQFFLALFLDDFLEVRDVLADTVKQPCTLLFAVFFGHSNPPQSVPSPGENPRSSLEPVPVRPARGSSGRRSKKIQFRPGKLPKPTTPTS